VCLGAFAGRTYKLDQIMAILKSGDLRERKFNRAIYIALAPMVLCFTFLAIVLIATPFDSTWILYTENAKFYRDCDNKSIDPKIVAGIPFVVEVAICCWLMRKLWGLENLQEQYREFTQILGLLFMAVTMFVAMGFLEIVSMNPYTKDTFYVLFFLMWFYFVLVFMLIPRFYKAFTSGKPPEGFVRQDQLEPQAEAEMAST